jgi:cell division protein FtsB
MKKQVLALAILGLLAFGCGNSTESQDPAPPTAEQVMAEKEAVKNDSLAKEIEKTNAEIKKASDELDAILNELN